jgi:V8-like Glu-specific endopeptidase
VDGLNVDQVRDLYNATGGTQLMNKTGSLRCAFLIADDEALSNASTTTVKAASADYTPVPYHPTPDSRGRRQ